MRIVVVDPGHGPRSQIAGALLASGLPDDEVISAGTAPNEDLAGVADVLAEVGIRWDADRRDLADLAGAPPDLLIAVCEEGCPACPYLPGSRRVLRWPFAEPPRADDVERLDGLRAIRDAVAARLDAWRLDPSGTA